MNKCWVCGRQATKHRNIGEKTGFFFDPYREDVQRCYCDSCFKLVMEQRRKDQEEYIRLKKKLMFERAICILEKQDLCIYDYKEAIDAVREFAEEQPDKFDSAYEMIAAIILVDNEIECKPQYKVGKYQCDFCLPEWKVILEIDGDRHRYKKSYDSDRDKAIIAQLGNEWHIVRIKTEYLDLKADMLVEAIKGVMRERIRKASQGAIAN